MKLKNLFLKTSILFSSILLLSTIFASSTHADNRCTPSDAEIARGINYEGCELGTTYPTFNRYLDNPFNDGTGTMNETDFFRVGKPTDEFYSNSRTVSEGDTLRFFVYMHNNCDATLPYQDCLAENAKLLIKSFNQRDLGVFTSGPQSVFRIEAEIAAKNTNPGTVTDYINVVSATNQPIELEYIAGSAVYWNGETGQEYTVSPFNLFGDGSRDGQSITSVARSQGSFPNGTFFGSNEYISYLELDVLVKEPQPELTPCTSFTLNQETFDPTDPFVFLRVTTDPVDYPAEFVQWRVRRNGQIDPSASIVTSATNREALIGPLDENTIIEVFSNDPNINANNDCARQATPEEVPVQCTLFTLNTNTFDPNDPFAFFQVTTDPADYPAEFVQWQVRENNRVLSTPSQISIVTSANNREALIGPLNENMIIEVFSNDPNINEDNDCARQATPEDTPDLPPACELFTLTPTRFTPGEETTFTVNVQPSDLPREAIFWEILQNGRDVSQQLGANGIDGVVEETADGIRITYPGAALTENTRIEFSLAQGFELANGGDCTASAIPENLPEVPPACELFTLTPTRFTPGQETTFNLTVTPRELDRNAVFWEILQNGRDVSQQLAADGIDGVVEETASGLRITYPGAALTENTRIEFSLAQGFELANGGDCTAVATPEPEIPLICEELTLTPESKTFIPVEGEENTFKLETLLPDDFLDRDGTIKWDTVPLPGREAQGLIDKESVVITTEDNNRTARITGLTENLRVEVTAVPDPDGKCADFSIPETEPEIPLTCEDLSLTPESRTFNPVPEANNRFTIAELLPNNFIAQGGVINWKVLPRDNRPASLLEANNAIIIEQNGGLSAVITGLTENVRVQVSAEPDPRNNCLDDSLPEEIPQLNLCRDLSLTPGSRRFTPVPTVENQFFITINPSDYPAEDIIWSTVPSVNDDQIVLSADRRQATITGLTPAHAVFVQATTVEQNADCSDLAIPEDEPLGQCVDLDIFEIIVNTDERTAKFSFDTEPPEFLSEVVMQVISGPQTGFVQDLGGNMGRLHYFTEEATVRVYVPGQDDCADEFTIIDEIETPQACLDLELFPPKFNPNVNCTDFVIDTKPSSYLGGYTVEPAQNVVRINGNQARLCGLTPNDTVRVTANGPIANGATCEGKSIPFVPQVQCIDAFVSQQSFTLEPGIINTFDLNVFPAEYRGNAFRWRTEPANIGVFRDSLQSAETLVTADGRVTFRTLATNVPASARVIVEAVDPEAAAACNDQIPTRIEPPRDPKLDKFEVTGKQFVQNGELVAYAIRYQLPSDSANKDIRLIDTVSSNNGRIIGDVNGQPEPNSYIQVDQYNITGVQPCQSNQPRRNCFSGDFLAPGGITLHQISTTAAIEIEYTGKVVSNLNAERCRQIALVQGGFCGLNFPNTVVADEIPSAETPSVPPTIINYNPRLADTYNMRALCPAFRSFGFGDIILEEDIKGSIDTLTCGERPNVPGIVIRPTPDPVQRYIPITGGDEEIILPDHAECRTRAENQNIFESISSSLCELEAKLSPELTSEPLAQLEANTARLCSNAGNLGNLTISNVAQAQAASNKNITSEIIVCADNITLENAELSGIDGNITLIARNNLTVIGDVTYGNNSTTTSLVATAGGQINITEAEEINGIYIVLPGEDNILNEVLISLPNGASSFTVLGSLIGTNFELPAADFNLIYDLGRFLITQPSVLNDALEFVQSISLGQ